MIAPASSFTVVERKPLYTTLPPIFDLMHTPTGRRCGSFLSEADALRVAGYLDNDRTVDWSTEPTPHNLGAFRLSFHGCCAMAGCREAWMMNGLFVSRETEDLEAPIFDATVSEVVEYGDGVASEGAPT